jgi:hypothetical protein
MWISAEDERATLDELFACDRGQISERCGVYIVVGRRNAKAIARMGNGVGRLAAVDLISGETRCIAEVLSP